MAPRSVLGGVLYKHTRSCKNQQCWPLHLLLRKFVGDTCLCVCMDDLYIFLYNTDSNENSTYILYAKLQNSLFSLPDSALAAVVIVL